MWSKYPGMATLKDGEDKCKDPNFLLKMYY